MAITVPPFEVEGNAAPLFLIIHQYKRIRVLVPHPLRPRGCIVGAAPPLHIREGAQADALDSFHELWGSMSVPVFLKTLLEVYRAHM